MSYSINILERYLNKYTTHFPLEVRLLISAIHDYSHNHNDLLNHDNKIRFAAQNN